MRNSHVCNVEGFLEGRHFLYINNLFLGKFYKHFSLHRESYLKKHQVSHHVQVTEESQNQHHQSNDLVPNKDHDAPVIVHPTVQRRFIDLERERRRFHTFSELYFQQQRSAFQYVCHQGYR